MGTKRQEPQAADLARTAIREPGVEGPRYYARRVHRLAVFYTGLFVASLVGIALLIWRAQFFVALTQRSNVETLVLAFFLVFFAYVAVLSAPGALGAARIARFAVLRRLGRDPASVERLKQAALGPPGPTSAAVALNVVVAQEGQTGESFTLTVADEHGSLGTLEVRGAEIRLREAPRHGSNSLLAFAAYQIQAVLRERGVEAELDVVEWKTLDDETTLQYLSLVRFAVNLERTLGVPPLWPKVVLTAADCAEIERRLRAICGAVRNELFLPRWEYAGEHKLPIIPEPLGLLTLSRYEKRVDPEASMGCAFLVILACVAVLALLIKFPPWVPGT